MCLICDPRKSSLRHEIFGLEAATADVGLVHGRELLVHLRRRVVRPDADRAQRVARRHEVLQSDRAEQALAVVVGASSAAVSRSSTCQIVLQGTHGDDRYINGLRAIPLGDAARSFEKKTSHERSFRWIDDGHDHEDACSLQDKSSDLLRYLIPSFQEFPWDKSESK